MHCSAWSARYRDVQFLPSSLKILIIIKRLTQKSAVTRFVVDYFYSSLRTLLLPCARIVLKGRAW